MTNSGKHLSSGKCLCTCSFDFNGSWGNFTGLSWQTFISRVIVIFWKYVYVFLPFKRHIDGLNQNTVSGLVYVDIHIWWLPIGVSSFYRKSEKNEFIKKKKIIYTLYSLLKDEFNIYWNGTLLTEILYYRTMEHFPGKYPWFYPSKSLWNFPRINVNKMWSSTFFPVKIFYVP